MVYTDYRPTPLQHYAFPMGGAGLYLIKDERGVFRSDNFRSMRSGFEAAKEREGERPQKRRAGGRGGRGGGRGADGNQALGSAAATPVGAGPGSTGGREEGDGDVRRELSTKRPSKGDMVDGIARVVKLIKDRNLDPAIVFSFSRRDCEQYALGLGKLDFCSAEEKEAIEEVFSNGIQCLSEEDRWGGFGGKRERVFGLCFGFALFL